MLAGVDSMHDENPPRTRALRKVVRLIVEKQGVNGKITKKDIVAHYKKGWILWRKETVAEWDDRCLHLFHEGGLGVDILCFDIGDCCHCIS